MKTILTAAIMLATGLLSATAQAEGRTPHEQKALEIYRSVHHL